MSRQVITPENLSTDFVLDRSADKPVSLNLNPDQFTRSGSGLIGIGPLTAQTAAPGSNTTQIATTAFVAAGLAVTAGASSAALAAALASGLISPSFTGVPTAPTAAPATNTAQIATTAFVAAGLSAAQVATAAALAAALVNTPLTGVPTAPTAAPGVNTVQVATTAFAAAAVAAALVNTNLTGVPLAPTAGAGTNTGQIANTAFVTTALNIVKAASQPIATTVAGLGQLFSVYAAASNAIFLPAGGTWAYFVTAYNSGGSLDTGGSAGVAAGGSQIGAASTGRQYNAMVWKIQ